jgi:hypothetical protein
LTGTRPHLYRQIDAIPPVWNVARR